MAEFWLGKTPSVPERQRAPRFADQIISLGKLVAKESSNLFSILKMDPINPEVLKKLKQKGGILENEMFQNCMKNRPPKWILEAIKVEQPPKMHYFKLDKNTEVSYICLSLCTGYKLASVLVTLI